MEDDESYCPFEHLNETSCCLPTFWTLCWSNERTILLATTFNPEIVDCWHALSGFATDTLSPRSAWVGIYLKSTTSPRRKSIGNEKKPGCSTPQKPQSHQQRPHATTPSPNQHQPMNRKHGDSSPTNPTKPKSILDIHPSRVPSS